MTMTEKCRPFDRQTILLGDHALADVEQVIRRTCRRSDSQSERQRYAGLQQRMLVRQQPIIAPLPVETFITLLHFARTAQGEAAVEPSSESGVSVAEPIYHTEIRPLDSVGSSLRPLDIVILLDIPTHYWSDPGWEQLKEFKGCYGLVTYYGKESECEPYYLGNKGHPGWVSGDGSVVNIHTRRIAADVVMSAEFWIPPSMLQKIPFNSLIMNIFSEYPWQMTKENGPGSELFIKKGIPEFDYLKTIMTTPYSTLAAAHDSAMAVLLQKPDDAS